MARKPPRECGGRPVLIIDTSADATPRETLARDMTRRGFSVLLTSDPLDAIGFCEEVHPCLIVLGDTKHDSIDASMLLHEIADILYEEPPSVALMLRGERRDGRSWVRISPLLVLEDLLDGADERCAA